MPRHAGDRMKVQRRWRRPRCSARSIRPASGGEHSSRPSRVPQGPTREMGKCLRLCGRRCSLGGTISKFQLNGEVGSRTELQSEPARGESFLCIGCFTHLGKSAYQ